MLWTIGHKRRCQGFLHISFLLVLRGNLVCTVLNVGLADLEILWECCSAPVDPKSLIRHPIKPDVWVDMNGREYSIAEG